MLIENCLWVPVDTRGYIQALWVGNGFWIIHSTHLSNSYPANEANSICALYLENVMPFTDCEAWFTPPMPRNLGRNGIAVPHEHVPQLAKLSNSGSIGTLACDDEF